MPASSALCWSIFRRICSARRSFLIKLQRLPHVIPQRRLLDILQRLELHVSRVLANAAQQAILVLKRRPAHKAKGDVLLGWDDPGENKPASPHQHPVAYFLGRLWRPLSHQRAQHFHERLPGRGQLLLHEVVDCFDRHPWSSCARPRATTGRPCSAPWSDLTPHHYFLINARACLTHWFDWLQSGFAGA